MNHASEYATATLSTVRSFINIFKKLGFLACDGRIARTQFPLHDRPHNSFPFSLTTITQGKRQATCIIESPGMSNCDQTARGLFGILPLTGRSVRPQHCIENETVPILPELTDAW
jgi:hypothetical protein